MAAIWLPSANDQLWSLLSLQPHAILLYINALDNVIAHIVLHHCGVDDTKIILYEFQKNKFINHGL